MLNQRADGDRFEHNKCGLLITELGGVSMIVIV